MAARYPLGYIAPAVGSVVMIPFSLAESGWLEAVVRDVVPHVGSRLPEVLAAPHGSLTTSIRSAEWRALGATEVRCGTCYQVVPDGISLELHAETDERHASIAAIVDRAPARVR